jgi:hypothetical protein
MRQLPRLNAKYLFFGFHRAVLIRWFAVPNATTNDHNGTLILSGREWRQSQV